MELLFAIPLDHNHRPLIHLEPTTKAATLQRRSDIVGEGSSARPVANNDAAGKPVHLGRASELGDNVCGIKCLMAGCNHRWPFLPINFKWDGRSDNRQPCGGPLMPFAERSGEGGQEKDEAAAHAKNP